MANGDSGIRYGYRGDCPHRSGDLRSGDRLARRVLSDNEWAIWETHQQPVRFLAKRFAVKEAAAKAFGTGIRNGLAFNQFEVFNDELGKPRLRLWGGVKTGGKTRRRTYACDAGR